tara:strand:+ start:863 stop:1858 length:996 start_codon:yes stop_codon:yes gene_type:complete
MALGLSSGLVWDGCAITVPPIINPLDNSMLLWWDFTDTTQMFQEVTSFTTAADANNDKIGRIKNKAITAQTGLGIADVARIGTFGRSTTSANRPTLKTGGANGYSYAQFSSSDNTNMVTKQGASFGSHDDGDNLMTGAILTDALTIVTVAECDNDDNDGVEESIWHTTFHKSGSSAEVEYLLERKDATNPGAGQANQLNFDNSDSGVSSLLQVPISPDMIMSAGKLEVRFTSIGLNGPGTAQQQRGLNTIDLAGLFNILEAAGGSFQSLVANGSSQDSSVFLGANKTGSPKNFDGKIYEFIMFSQTLDIDTMNGLAWYYAQKYGIDIQGPN